MAVARSAWVGSLLMLMVGDTRPRDVRPKDVCEQAMEAKDYRVAALRCDQAFARNRDPLCGIRAARAHLMLAHYDDAARLAESLKDGPELATALQVLGNIHAKRGLLAPAQDELSRALSLHRASGDHDEAARDAFYLASVHEQQVNYREAIADLRTTQSEARLGHDVPMQGYALMGLGFLFDRIGDGVSSERAYGAAASVLAGANVGDGVNVRLSQADLDLQMGRYASARETLHETLALAERSGRADLVGLVHLRLATTLRELSELVVAADHLEQAARC